MWSSRQIQSTSCGCGEYPSIYANGSKPVSAMLEAALSQIIGFVADVTEEC